MIPNATTDEGLLVQIASYNTNLQGVLGLPQDLVDWLSPTLQVSKFLSGGKRSPDIIAVGFQELLPLHIGRMYVRSSPLNYANFVFITISCRPIKSRSRQPRLAHTVTD